MLCHWLASRIRDDGHVFSLVITIQLLLDNTSRMGIEMIFLVFFYDIMTAMGNEMANNVGRLEIFNRGFICIY